MPADSSSFASPLQPIQASPIIDATAGFNALWNNRLYGMYVMEVIAGGEDFRFLAFNEVIAKICPIPVQPLLGKRLNEAFEPAVAKKYKDRYATCVSSGHIVEFEERFISAVGEIWWNLSIDPVRNAANEIYQLIVTVADISAQRSAETTKARLLAILEATPDIISVTDAQGLHHYLNRAGQLVFDIGIGSVETLHLSDIMHPESVQMLLSEALPIAETKGSWHGEAMIRDCHGRNVLVSHVIICHKSAEGSVLHFSSIMRDISDRKAAEALLRDTAERQAVLNQITSEVRNSLDLDTVISTTLMSVHQGLKLDYCAFAWIDNSDSSIDNPGQPSWEIVQAIDDTDHGIPLGEHPNDRLGLDIYSLINQSLTRVDNANQCEDTEHQAFLKRLGISAEILIPVRTDADKTGVIICCFVHHAHTWSSGEIELLQAVGDQLAIAINQANLYTQSCVQSQQLVHTLDQLKRTQTQIIQAEKMSSLGQMVAGVAHEINNPVNFIHGNLQPAQDYTADLFSLIDLYRTTYPQATAEIAARLEAVDLEFVQEDLPKLLKSMVVGTERIREIVLSLRNFSRLDEAAAKTVDLHDGIDSTLIILSHRLKATSQDHTIQVVKHYGDLPQVDCYPSQLNQVFMNIFANAIDALDACAEPRLTITTALKGVPHEPDACAVITIADNGSGIPPEIQPQILDPFFTTKPVGKGTGMGMSISYQIITEKHGGELTFSSQIGQGTAFVITIPIRQAAAT